MTGHPYMLHTVVTSVMPYTLPCCARCRGEVTACRVDSHLATTQPFLGSLQPSSTAQRMRLASGPQPFPQLLYLTLMQRHGNQPGLAKSSSW